MFRVSVLSQEAPIKTNDPEYFKICVGAQLFRVNQTVYPLIANKVSVKSL